MIILLRKHANKLLIGLENSLAKTKTKIAKFRSRYQDRGLEDYVPGITCNMLISTDGRRTHNTRMMYQSLLTILHLKM